MHVFVLQNPIAGILTKLHNYFTCGSMRGWQLYYIIWIHIRIWFMVLRNKPLKTTVWFLASIRNHFEWKLNGKLLYTIFIMCPKAFLLFPVDYCVCSWCDGVYFQSFHWPLSESPLKMMVVIVFNSTVTSLSLLPVCLWLFQCLYPRA